MNRLLAILLLLPLFAQAQGVLPPSKSESAFARGSTVRLSESFTTNGPMIVEDANTVLHTYWQGGARVDTKGVSWIDITNYGVIAQTGPFNPPRWSYQMTNGYLRLTNGPSDVLDFAGDFTGCAVYRCPYGANDWTIISNRTSVHGWDLNSRCGRGSLGNLAIFTQASSTVNLGNLAPDAIEPANGIIVACFGRSGTTGYIKTNGSATQSANVGPADPATDAYTYVGSDPVSTNGAVNMHIYEIYFTSSAWDEAKVTEIQNRVLGHVRPDGRALTVTRDSLATFISGDCGAGQCMYSAGKGVLRITPQGALIEESRTNYAQRSNTISTTTAFNAPWVSGSTTVTTTSGGFIDGYSNWAAITNTVNTQNANQPITIPSSTTIVGSAWTRTASGTGAATVVVGCGGAVPSACACMRSDGGSCTASTVATNYCAGKITGTGLTTTPVRLSTMVTCNAGTTSTYLGLAPGEYGVSTGTAYFGGAQLEIGLLPTSLIITPTTASVTRNADVVSIPNPLPSSTTKWCLRSTVEPNELTTWARTGGPYKMWFVGTAAGANTAYLNLTSNFGVFDASNTQKYLATFSASGTGPKTVTSCTLSGNLKLFVNGGQQNLAVTGSTGVIQTQPASIAIGSGAGIHFLNGFVKDLTLCTGPNPESGCK